jgi:hypothetical protein
MTREASALGCGAALDALAFACGATLTGYIFMQMEQR